MKRFISKFILLVLIVAVPITSYCLFAEKANSIYFGMSTAKQVKTSFHDSVSDDYNCYFLGNSRIYRDVNPDMFTSVKAYNFGHDNDSYNQMYYKLLYLLDQGQEIDYLFIGTDYFQFSFLSDSRNYIYSKLLPRAYMEDFSLTTAQDIWSDRMMRLWSNKQRAMENCKKYIKGEPATVRYLKDNGQYIVEGKADGTETVDRDYTVMEIQYQYYEKIIKLCEEEGIELYVIMPPLWKAEVETHEDSERDTFNQMIRDSLKGTPFENNYINYSEIEGLSDYTDFIDMTHLTPEAADEYSSYLNTMIFEEK